mgnify:CR=1 FL=1
MDTVDDSPFPLRPIDESGMEEINTIGIGEYDYHGGSVVVAKKVRPPAPLKGRLRSVIYQSELES